MAVSVDQSTLGTNTEAGSDNAITLTTTATVATAATIIVGIIWDSASFDVSTVGDGTHSYTIHPHPGVGFGGPGNIQQALASAYAPSGLASGATITVTFAGAVVDKQVCASSFLGVLGTLPYDDDDATFDANPISGNPTWALTLVTSEGGCLLLGLSVAGQDGSRQNTPTSPASELHQWAIGTDNTAALVYRVASSSGSNAVGGQWNSDADNGIGQVGVALKSDSSSPPPGGGGEGPRNMLTLGVG